MSRYGLTSTENILYSMFNVYSNEGNNGKKCENDVSAPSFIIIHTSIDEILSNDDDDDDAASSCVVSIIEI